MVSEQWSVNSGQSGREAACRGSWFPTLAMEKEEAGPSTSWRSAPDERGWKCRISPRPYGARDRAELHPRAALRLPWAILAASLREAMEPVHLWTQLVATSQAAQDDTRDGVPSD